MKLLKPSQETKAVALAFFEGVKSDLETFGGVDIDRIQPLKRSKDFANAVFDQVGILLAQQYSQGELDFEGADWIANTVQSEMITLMVELQAGADLLEFPEGWSEVYEAFDSGEFDHFGCSKDPVAEFTNPSISAFLSRLNEELEN